VGQLSLSTWAHSGPLGSALSSFALKNMHFSMWYFDNFNYKQQWQSQEKKNPGHLITTITETMWKIYKYDLRTTCPLVTVTDQWHCEAMCHNTRNYTGSIMKFITYSITECSSAITSTASIRSQILSFVTFCYNTAVYIQWWSCTWRTIDAVDSFDDIILEFNKSKTEIQKSVQRQKSNQSRLWTILTVTSNQ